VSERIRSWVAVTVIAACAGLIVAVLATADPSPADRVEALATRLKCPVCQSESINDSPAQLSRDLKALIADQVADGWTDQQIVDFFIATYGEEVLLDPPAGGRTALLWVLPAILLVGGLALIVTRVRGSGRELSEEERRRVDQAVQKASR
jgi:cytochrome c-type biogenesis protein CcmH